MRDALVALLAENQFDPVPMANITEYRETEQTERTKRTAQQINMEMMRRGWDSEQAELD